MRLAVVTVNYRCAGVLAAEMASTARQISRAGGIWYIVDNRSPDDSLPVLRGAMDGIDQVELIEADRNGGFGYGNNRGIDHAIGGPVQPDYIYLLNPDAVPDPGSIERMMAYLDAHPPVGIVGSALANADGSPTESMFRFPSLLSEVETALAIGPASRLLERHRVPLPRLTRPGPVDWVSGASFMIRTDVLRTVGGFDEDFFLYWEEVELCHRVRNAGFEIHGLPNAKVTHIGGVSTGVGEQARMPGYWHQSRNLFFRKTGAGGPLFLLNLVTAASLAVGRGWQWLRGKPGHPPRFVRDHIRYAFGSQPAIRR